MDKPIRRARAWRQVHSKRYSLNSKHALRAIMQGDDDDNKLFALTTYLIRTYNTIIHNYTICKGLLVGKPHLLMLVSALAPPSIDNGAPIQI